MPTRFSAFWLSCLAALALSALLCGPARAQVGTNFTYQGEFHVAGAPYTGTADYRITIYSSASGGTIVAGPLLHGEVHHTGGRFLLDISGGGLVPPGAHLQIEVRTPHDPSDTAPYTLLSPRQPITPAPLATLAGTAETATLATSATNAFALGGQTAAFYQSASNLTAGTLSDLRLSSNAALLNGAQTFSGAKTFLNSTLALRNAGNTASTTLAAPSATTTRTLSLPDATGTLISTGNLSNITATGTIASGTWNGTVVGVAHGGTGSSLSTTGGAGQFLRQASPGAALSVGAIAASDLGSVALGGDLSGAPASATVARVQGRGVSAAAPAANDVLKWNGASWAPAPDVDTNTTYSAGSGLNLTGTTFSIPTDGVTGGMILDGTVSAADIGADQVASADLASDAASLQRVSGGAMTSDGANIAIGGTPTSTLHIQKVLPSLAIQSTVSGGTASLDLAETVSGDGLGARIRYDGNTNRLSIGTIPSAGTFTTAMIVNRGSFDVEFAGEVLAPTFAMPATARSLLLAPANFIPTNNSTSYFVDSSTLQNTQGAGIQAQFYAPVNLPDGAVITGFTVICLDNDPSEDVTVNLHRGILSNANFSNLAAVTTSAASTLVRTFDSAVIAHAVDHSANSYTVRATWNGPLPSSSNIRLLGVRINYTITSPLP